MRKIKTKHFIIGGAGLIFFALILFSALNMEESLNSQSTSKTNNALGNRITGNTPGNGEYQEATLSMKNWEYILTPSTLKKGIPVRMTVDLKTVVGCAADVTIKEFGVRKYVKQGDNVIEFTPTKTGIIPIACSMNMFFGKFEVVDESNPNAPAEVQSTSIPATMGKTVGGSCGMASGVGCGCGIKNV